MEKTKETIKLFKSVLVDELDRDLDENMYAEVCGVTVPLGFVLDRKIVSQFSTREINKVIAEVKDEYVVTGEEMNNTFHKSWEKIKNASMMQLVVEQIAHYITTYGYESIGAFSNNTVYIPDEVLEVPELTEKLPLIYISGLTREELKEKLMKLINSGIALKNDTIKLILDVTELFDINNKEVSSIKNKEVKTAMYEAYGMFPEDPLEFLRYLVYRTTDETLLIKNRNLVKKIKAGKLDKAEELLKEYYYQYGFEALASIFYRFKPIFLAFKGSTDMSNLINQIRRLAPQYHKPMKEDFLNSITGKLKNNEPIAMGRFTKELRDVNIFRKIRLAYALNFRTTGCDSVIYRVRNGRGYASEFEFRNPAGAERLLKATLQEIANDLFKNVDGKKIYIPENFVYALPSTEKMFTGNLPTGSYVKVDKDMIFGVHWNDVPGHRVDLDLSLINVSGKIGWDSMYRSSGRDILFSGDMTSAGGKNGATELFYIKNMMPSVNLMSVNYYNYSEKHPVPFKIIVGEEKMSTLPQNHMINPNNVKAVSKTIMTEKQKTLGIAVTDSTGCRFYFTETNMGAGISARKNDATEHARKFMYNYYMNTISLNDLLPIAGAEIVDNPEDADIDLSPEVLEKDTIINLLVKNE